MSNDVVFRQKLKMFMPEFMNDFDLNKIQAAGVFGNLGHESGGFLLLREIGQAEGKGGYGWAQWTGPRREAFLSWCKQKGFNWQADEANYGFLKLELQTTHKKRFPE